MAGDAFQKFKSSVNRGITTISVKTSSSLEKSKIKTHIESLEKDVQKLLFSIGECTYDVWKSSDTDYQKITDKLTAVKQKKDEIERLTAELGSIDDRDNQILGKNQEPSPEESEPKKKGIFCPTCGEWYEAPVKFCRKCGQSLQNNAE